MNEKDPTAIEPDDSGNTGIAGGLEGGDLAEPSEPVEDQTPPPEYEPQVDVTPDQGEDRAMVERPAETLQDVEAEEAEVTDEDVAELGDADDDDDSAEDGEPDEEDPDDVD